MTTPALLALADGELFRGISIGVHGSRSGEMVFNTAMSGYQETLSDPTFARQIISFGYPHIGNVGCNAVDEESARVHAAGLVVRDVALLASSWRSEENLGRYLRKHDVVGIAGVDTRRLTLRLRDGGTQGACILAGEDAHGDAAIAQALEKARSFAGLDGVDLSVAASTSRRQFWHEGSYDLDRRRFVTPAARWHVAVLDLGVKRSLLRALCDRGCRLTVVPANTSAADILELAPDGVFLSNGPGDPAACAARATVAQLLEADVPVLGAGLGCQLLVLAAGGRVQRRGSAHRGAQHPVRCLAGGAVQTCTQNHGFLIVDDDLPADLQISHRSLLDGSVQALRMDGRPVSGFLGYPCLDAPAPAGPSLLDPFIHQMEARANSAA